MSKSQEAFVARHIAVVGAGLAGAVLAHELHQAGHRVEVFEKSRGPGGRLSSKRHESVVAGLDMGAPALQAEEPGWLAQLEQWQQQGWVQPWLPRQGSWLAGEGVRLIAGQRQWVGVPSMHTPVKALLADIPVQRGVRIEKLEAHRQHITPVDAVRSYGQFDFVALAVPAPQAEPLLVHSPSLLEFARQVQPDPCWVSAIQLQQPGLDWPLDWVDLQGHPQLTRVVRHTAKPGRQQESEVWVLYANRRWSLEHLQADKAWVAEQMAQALAELVGQSLSWQALQSHRWLYARLQAQGSVPAFFDYQRRIALCADWLGGTGAQGAWRSGMACARSMLAALGRKDGV